MLELNRLDALQGNVVHVIKAITISPGPDCQPYLTRFTG